ncbi:metal-dependent hydrolase [Geoalkalibacter subterraneus]|uniref:metal-dependent hydrolase n=1 Tax=Geoalkalibacter subterraneus TaxID=483547 RepID=UPI000694F261|nr:metal-dependent hydrolase [Geoalkalibacter subterraneus]
MMAPTHALTGIAAYLALAQAFPQVLAVNAVTIAAATLGSVAPDIDEPRSWIGKRLMFLSVPLLFIARHRGFTHSLLAAALGSVGVFWLFHPQYGLTWVLAFFVGFVAHLFGDWNTNSGVPLLWPCEKRYRAPWAFATGGFFETIFLLVLSVLIFLAGKQWAADFLRDFKI